jgi:4-amino-4-deoxy-L-arabinose transferase-like glycosyltransferase
MTRREGAALAALLAIGLALRLPSFADAMFGDEVSTYFVVEGHGLRQALDLVLTPQEQTPPLYFVLAWLSQRLWADSDALRLPSLLAGVGLIGACFALGREVGGRGAALLAGALAALSPVAIFYSTEARAYALAALCVTVSTLGLLRALRGGGRRWWALYAAGACAAVYSHYTTAFPLAAQALWALVFRRASWRPLLASSGLAALAFAPWLPELRDDQRDPVGRVIAALHPLTAGNVRRDLEHLIAGSAYAPMRDVPTGPAFAAIAAGIALAVAGALRAGRPRATASSPTGLLLVTGLASPAIALAVSLAGTSVYLSRNLLASLPMLLTFVAVCAARSTGRWRVAAGALLLAGYGTGAIATVLPSNRRPDADGAVAWIAGRSAPSDPVVQVTLLNGPGVLQPVEIALADAGLASHPVVRVGAPPRAADLARRSPGGPGQFAPLAIPPAASLAPGAAAAARSGRMFVVLYALTMAQLDASPTTGNPARAFIRALPGRWSVTASRTFGGIGPVQVLELRRA